MTKDNRDILEVLQQELIFIEENGYRAKSQPSWHGTAIFRDSPTCLNYGYPYRAHPCSECHLIDFVAPDHKREWIPCHFIHLNESGETVNSLEVQNDEDRMRQSVTSWLKTNIDLIEEERSLLAMAGCP